MNIPEWMGERLGVVYMEKVWVIEEGEEKCVGWRWL